MTPIGIFTTVQPFLLVWVMTISFFSTVAIIALLSKGRSWNTLMWMFGGCYIVLTVVAMLVATQVAGVNVIDIDVVVNRVVGG